MRASFGRRAALAAVALPALAACAAPLPLALRAPVVPADPSVTFHALLAGQPVAPLAAATSPWQVGVDPPSSVEVAGDALRFTGAPGQHAWASPRLPLADLTARRAGQIEDLAWDTTVTLTQRYFVVCELRLAGEPGAILVQATPFDLQAFQDAARPGGGQSESVSRLVADERDHLWRLRVDDSGLALQLDGTVIWRLDGPHAIARVAFGETRDDQQHGGTMLLRNVVYVRRPA